MSVGSSLAFFAGCTVTNEDRSDARKRQDAALEDPFAYDPRNDDEEVDRSDITGGGSANLNKKALKRDWDAFWGK